MQKHVLTLIVCLLPACASRAPNLEPRPTKTVAAAAAAAPLDSLVEKWMRDSRTPGLSLAVLRDGKLTTARGYGLANLETGTRVTPSTVFRIASLSKQFIATAIMLLVQEGRMSLDDHVTKYLSDAPVTWNDITIRQLLTHTSGLVRDPVDYHPYSEQPITDVIAAVYALPLASRPGDKWLYSNVGYYVLAEVISQVSGKPWDTFIAERLFAPAHMTATRTANVTDIVAQRASGYQWVNNTLVNAESWIAVRPSSAFLSSVLDLAAWDAYIDSTDPLSPASRRLMRTPAQLNDQTSVDYGFGWYVDSFLGRTRIHHDGQYPGFRTDYERFEDDRLSVIVLANSDQADLQSLAVKVAGFFAATLATPPFTLSAAVATQPVAGTSPVAVRIVAQDDGKAAPNSLVEMEIWDAAGKTIYKQHQSGENFDAGQTKTYTFDWTPTAVGTYSVNVGVYGPRWTPSYAWKEGAATITVR